MNNMNLLDFKFVDREIERKIIYNFLTESRLLYSAVKVCFAKSSGTPGELG